MLFLVLGPGGAAGADLAAGAAVAEADSALAPVPAELEDAVAELELADQPLPERDLAVAAAAGLRVGSFSWRLAAASGGWRHDVRAGWSQGALQGRAVLRLRPGLAAEAGGAAGFGGPALCAWAGNLVLRHGLGLVATDPGRRATPAADGTLARTAGGLAPVTSAGDRSLRIGLGAGRSGWRLEGLMAARPDSGRPRDWAARMAHGDRGTTWSVLVARDSLGTRLGAAGRLARTALAVDWELASGPGLVPLAAVAGLAWQPVPRLRVEFMSGASHGSPVSRCAVLPGGASRGWAGRLQWRERGVGALAVLLQGAEANDEGAGDPLRRRLSVQEATWERQAAGGVRAFLRCRRTSRRPWQWSGRAPWLPATAGPASVRTLVAAGVERESGPALLGAHWRAFTAADGQGAGTRQSLSLLARRTGSNGRELRVEATTAWGDPVDLVQATSPLPGLVVPRHWGRWRSELVVGGSAAWGPLKLRAALARRLPDGASAAAGPPAGAALEGWVEARGSW